MRIDLTYQLKAKPKIVRVGKKNKIQLSAVDKRLLRSKDYK